MLCSWGITNALQPAKRLTNNRDGEGSSRETAKKDSVRRGDVNENKGEKLSTRKKKTGDAEGANKEYLVV